MGDKDTELTLDLEIARKTRESFRSLGISKPSLTDKLLSKPPFHFLHDLITSVIKNTGFMNGLFTEVEMNHENVKDKESKIEFLQKTIDFISLVTGKMVNARPMKIIAGRSPDKTNEFLQQMALAVSMKVDNDDYVKRILEVRSKNLPTGPEAGNDASKRTAPVALPPGSKGEASNLAGEVEFKANTLAQKSLTKPKSSNSAQVSVVANKANTLAQKSLTKPKSSNSAQVSVVANKSPDKLQTSKSAEVTVSKDIKTKSDSKESKDGKQGRQEVEIEKKKAKSEIKGSQVKDPKVKSQEMKVGEARGENKKIEEDKTANKSTRPVSKVGNTEMTQQITKTDAKSELKHGKNEERSGANEDRSKLSLKNGDKVTTPRESVVKKQDGKEREKATEGKNKEQMKRVEASGGNVGCATDSADKLLPKQTDVARTEEKIVSREKRSKSRSRVKNEDGDLAARTDKTQNDPPSTKINDSAGTLEGFNIPTPKRQLIRPSSTVRAKRQPKTEDAPSEDVITMPKVIVDNADGNLNDDDDVYITMRDAVITSSEIDGTNLTDTEEHGKLVRTILTTKGVLEKGITTKTEIDRSEMIDLSKKKERENFQKEVNLLRNGIQEVTKQAASFVKVLEYLQEDADSMEKECEVWRMETKQNLMDLENEKSLTISSVEPLQTQLDDLNREILQQMEMNASIKSQLLQNRETIKHILRSSIKQTTVP